MADFFSSLYLLLIYPLQLLFEVVFDVSNRNIHNIGGAIICLSLVVNILVLPLYIRAEKIQNRQRETEEKLVPGIKHINKSFTGDERFMMLQMFYKLNSYNPIMSLRSAMSLLLQIPFFIAAYNMLSNLKCLVGASFLFVDDLSKPDAFFQIGSLPVNLLPIIMTLINVIAGIIYTRKHSIKEKIQINGMAIIFLVLLYNSPAGLTLYWTLNNIFSLIKNIVVFIGSKIKIDGNIFKKFTNELKSIVSQIPDSNSSTNMLFIVSGSIVAALTGFLIPSALVADSPIELSNPFTMENPNALLRESSLVAFGLFVVWFSIVYFMLAPKGRTFFSKLSLVTMIVLLINYFFSSKVLSSGDVVSKVNYVFILLLACALTLFVCKRFRAIINVVTFVVLGTIIVMGCLNIRTINAIYSEFVKPDNNGEVSFQLSKEGQNVIVIMLDRGSGYSTRESFNLVPGLKEQYDGFVFYPNTISLAGHTNMATPSLFGGYDYTPENINARSDESLCQKHNEALKVMPTIFSDNGYEVTVIDPPYAGYQEIPDISIYDDINNTSAYYTGSTFNPYAEEQTLELLSNRERNLFLYGLKSSLVFTKDFVYDHGNYNNPNLDKRLYYGNAQNLEFAGTYYNSINYYYTLKSLPDMTCVIDGDNDNFLMLQSPITHENALLFNNLIETPFDKEQFITDINSLENCNGVVSMNIYTAGVSLSTLGDWFDFLREQGVYDNTRIIIVADHGYWDNYLDNCQLPENYTTELYNPMFLVKDFNSEGFTVSEAFMTNADTSALAVDGLINNPTNPFTGNKISASYKYDNLIRVCGSNDNSITKNNGNVFTNREGWYTIADTSDSSTTFNADNWIHSDT
ncbi:MAG: membrane protein insertase YidC [Saccharofermentans sp.]|nr:membrane protein insertase YidC [Saccharofermentans sp.]